MHLQKEVATKPPRSPLGEILFGTKLTMLVVGLAAGLPLGMIYAFQTGMHTCDDPIVVTISDVRTSPDPELDAYLEARQRARDASECRECHSEHGRPATLSDMELCLTDDPCCRWGYEIQPDRRVYRVPNRRAVRAFQVKRMRPETIRLDRRDTPVWEPSPGHALPDMLTYESF